MSWYLLFKNLLYCSYFMFFFIIHDNKLNIFGFCCSKSNAMSYIYFYIKVSLKTVLVCVFTVCALFSYFTMYISYIWLWSQMPTRLQTGFKSSLTTLCLVVLLLAEVKLGSCIYFSRVAFSLLWLMVVQNYENNAQAVTDITFSKSHH